MPFGLPRFSIMCIIAFLIKRIKVHLVSQGEATVKPLRALHG